MIIICRNTIITYFNNLKLKYNYLINKLYYFKLNIITFFQIEFKNILLNFYQLIKCIHVFKIIKFLPKLLTIYNYFSKLQFLISIVQNNNIINLLNFKNLNV